MNRFQDLDLPVFSADDRAQAPAPAPVRVRVRSAGALRCVLAGLGLFALTVGVLLRCYAAPALITAPAGFYGTQTLVAPHATYFDQAKLTMRRNAPLIDTDAIRGDASAATPATVTWDSYSALSDPGHRVTLAATYQRAVFNRRTAELADCCGAAVNDDPRIRQYGVAGMFWPIGTGKTTYLLYDTSTERAWPAVYSGTANVRGILAYKYVQRIPSTLVQKMPGIPMAMLGVPAAQYSVTANRTFQAVNTFWVDPRTGVPVDIDENVSSVLHDPAGNASLTAVAGDFRLSPASQANLVAMANLSAAEIGFLRVSGPAGGIAVGLALALAAVVRRPDRRKAAVRLTAVRRPAGQPPEPALN